MTVRELLGDGPAVEIGGLAYDNRAVEPGTLFFCVPGFTRDGHDFASDAIGRGAAALVVARPLNLGVPAGEGGGESHPPGAAPISRPTRWGGAGGRWWCPAPPPWGCRGCGWGPPAPSPWGTPRLS